MLSRYAGRRFVRPKQDRQWVERLQRAFAQRIYLIAEPENPENYVSSDGTSFHFKVMGNSNLIYNIKIGQKRCLCTCADFRHRHFCKHLIFILLRLLHVPEDHVSFNRQQTTALYIEACKSFIIDRFIELFPNHLSNTPIPEISNQQEQKRHDDVDRKPLSDEINCPICFEKFEESLENTLWCEVCKKNIHEDCFKQWIKVSKNAICVYCRSSWKM
jgi:hypothetical protein